MRRRERRQSAVTRAGAELKAINAALVVPSFIEDKLLAIIVLGNKLSGAIYTTEDFFIIQKYVAFSAYDVGAALHIFRLHNTVSQNEP